MFIWRVQSAHRANEKLLNPDEDLEISQDSIKLKDYPDIEI